MRHCPQIALTNHDKDGSVRDGIGGEMLELDTIVVDERPHEPARGTSEPVVVKFDEANHVAF